MTKELPAKESSLFKQILKFYEHKQYKKGLKQCDQILRKFPEHGETLCMKGLFCHLLHREDGLGFVKQGLRLDIRSHICWHVYGLCHRQDRNYEEAAKCYAQALRCDKDNLQILRDYAMLQIQMRNYEAFNESRVQLLNLRPQNKMNWFGLACSYHLLQKYDMAEKVLVAFMDANRDETPGPLGKYEDSEMFMYHNFVIEESGDLQRALDHLESIKEKVLDKKAWSESRARLLLKLGDFAQSEVVLHQLMQNNPDSHLYINSLLACRGLLDPSQLDDAHISPDNVDQALVLLDELSDKYPRSQLPVLLSLQYSEGPRFVKALDPYLVKNLRKGVPSLFNSLKHVLENPEKLQIVKDTLIDYTSCLSTLYVFHKSDANHGRLEPPTALMWTWYFLAQMHDSQQEYVKALELIGLAISHSPTVVELHMTKAKIYKHAQDLDMAMKAMDEARNLDLQDRFVNSKCTKYMIRNKQFRKAEETISLFTRVHEIIQSQASEPLLDLIEMQCVWYTVAKGCAHMDSREFGPALKCFHQIEQHFGDIYDDQFDFHAYGLRKMTLRSYIDMLRCHDRLRSHPFYVKAATAAVKTYLDYYDNPPSFLPSEAELGILCN